MARRTKYALAFLSAVMFLTAVPSVFADTATAAEAEKAIGSNVEKFSTLADRTMKGALTFFAILLLGAQATKKLRSSRNAKPDQNEIEILNRKGIGPKSSLVLVRVRGKELLIGSSGEAVTLLSEFSSGPQFAEIFSDSCDEFDFEDSRANG